MDTGEEMQPKQKLALLNILTTTLFYILYIFLHITYVHKFLINACSQFTS